MRETGPGIDALSALERPFFTAWMSDGGIVAEGTTNCLLGHRLERSGPGVPDGLYVEWTWDGERLEVRNDRYGIYPLYYASYGREIRLSPAIQHVLNGRFPKTLDYRALAVFLRLGFFIGEDTPFEHIRALPPGSTLTWHRGELSLSRGSLETDAGERDLCFDEAVDRYAALFEQSIGKRLPPSEGECVVPLSGGRDSRHILFELMRQGHVPDRAVTVQFRPPSANEDLRIARILAETFGLEHSAIPPAPSHFQAQLKDAELTGLCSSGHSWLLPIAAFLKGRTRTLYDGLAGSVISGGFQADQEKLMLFKAGRLNELAGALLRARNERALSSIISPSFARRVTADLAIERLTSELENHRDARNPLGSYIFWNRTRRGVALAPFSILADIPTVYCPYLDHELFDFLINLDPSHSLHNALHDETLRRAYPRYAAIPFEDKGAQGVPDHASSAYYRRSVREFLAYYWHHHGLRTSFIRNDHLLPTALRDLMNPRCRQPWYLQPALHLLELERITRG